MATAPKQAASEFDTTTRKIKTRIEDGGAQHETILTIVWDDDKAARVFAERGVAIAAQAVMRATGDIPAEYTVHIGELSKRERGGFAMKATPENAKRMLDKLSDDEYRAAMLAIGISASDAAKMVAKRKAK